VLQAAVERGHLGAAATQPATGAEVNVPPSAHQSLTYLGHAIENSDVAMVRLLLQNRADPNQAFFKSYTSRRRRSTICLLEALRRGNDEICDELIDYGADPNAQRSTETALILTTRSGRHSLMQMLLDRGADVNAMADEFYVRTALGVAAFMGDLSAAKMLLEAGASTHVSKAPWRIHSPLMCAVDCSHRDTKMAQIPLNADAEVCERFLKKDAARYMQILHILDKCTRDRSDMKDMICSR
jgi:ankyrin repeat protein